MVHISPGWDLVLLWDILQRYGLSTRENNEQLCELCFTGPYLDCKTEASEAEFFVLVGSSALILTTKMRMCSFTFEN